MPYPRASAYVGFFYPNASNLLVDVQSPSEFEALWECRAWVEDMALDYAQEILSHGNGYDYECSLNCDMSGGKPSICEETRE